jgi:Enoyl-[acyl-carrier-protein] reductase [NADH] (EC 1.3.1.9)
LKKVFRLIIQNIKTAVIECDVNSDESISKAFTQIGEQFGVIHGIVHSVAFAHAEDLKNTFC